MQRWAAGLLTLLVAAFFYRPLSTETFYFRDVYQLFYAKKSFFASAIHAGELPLWVPLSNGGEPFLAMPTNFALHPSNLLYLVLPAVAALNLIIVVHVLFCALAAYWLARVVRLPPAASFVAAAVFAFCGYTLSLCNLTLFLLALPWIPVTVALLHRAMRDGRSLAPAAFAAAMPLFAGAAEVTAMLFATVAVWLLASRYGVSRRGRAIALAFVLIGAAGLSLLQTLPATSVIEQSSRSRKRTYEAFTNWSVRPERLPELVVPRFLGDLHSLQESRYWDAVWRPTASPTSSVSTSASRR